MELGERALATKGSLGTFEFALEALDLTVFVLRLLLQGLSLLLGFHFARVEVWDGGHMQREALDVGYKMRVLYYLLYELGKAHSPVVPDPGWQEARWMDLTEAREWQDLAWFPGER